MRKRIFLLGCIGVLLSNLFLVRTYADVGVGAQSAVVLEQSSGRILYAKNKDQKLRIASITKIMTAILAVESGKMNDMVTVSDTAVRTEGSSLYLKPGQKIKLADLVYGLMLRSGNDAAQAIAETVGGSIEGFVFLMNKKAEEIGMKNTQFINPHGLDGQGMQHYSSAYDMALLTRYAMQNAGYREIAGTKEHKAPNTEEQWDYVWRNKNKLLTILYEYSTGGKTGFTKQAGRTLVSTASKEGLDLICVTLNDGNDWQDHMNLFNDGFKNYQLSKVIGKGPLSNVGEAYKGHAYVKDTYSYPVTAKEKDTVSVTYDLVDKKEPDDGEKIGTASIYVGKEKVGERAVFYSKSAFKLEALYWLDEIKNVFSAMTGVEQDG